MTQMQQPEHIAHHAGSVFVVSAPSGAGKSSLVKALLAQTQGIGLSISSTTRAARVGEVDGKDYHFISEPQFEAIREADGFLEWAHVHGNYYGTSRQFVESKIADDQDVLLEIDWQGAEQVVRKLTNVVSIFILPPSMEELRSRLIGRGTDAPEVIERRLGAAQLEIEQARRFDYVIVNDVFEQALLELKSIVVASRCRFVKQMARHGDQMKKIGL